MIRRRPLLGRLIRWPRLLLAHYRLLREAGPKGLPRREALRCAWRLSLVLFR